MTIFEIPAVNVQDFLVGQKFRAQDGVELIVIATDYSHLDSRDHTLTLSDGKEQRTFGKNWWAWALQYRNAAEILDHSPSCFIQGIDLGGDRFCTCGLDNEWLEHSS